MSDNAIYLEIGRLRRLSMQIDIKRLWDSIQWRISKRRQGQEREMHMQKPAQNHNVPILRFTQTSDLFLGDSSKEEALEISKLGQALREMRSQTGYSRSQLASLLNVDLELIVAVENGMGNRTAAQDLLRDSEKRLRG